MYMSSYTSIFDDPNFDIEDLLQEISVEVGVLQAQQVQAIYDAAQQQGNTPPGSPGANVTTANNAAPSPGSHKGGRKTKRKSKKRRKRKTKKRRKRRRKKRR